MTETTDVLIIGAGPSGTVASTLLRNKGHDCIVLERDTFPRFSIAGMCWRFGVRAAIAMISVPLTAVLIAMATIGWTGNLFSLFNLFALLLVVGISIDYAVFFHLKSGNPGTLTELIGKLEGRRLPALGEHCTVLFLETYIAHRVQHTGFLEELHALRQ